MDETDLTDAGLKHLYGLRSLKTLWISGAKISVDGVDELRSALPSLTKVRMGKRNLVRATVAPSGGR